MIKSIITGVITGILILTIAISCQILFDLTYKPTKIEPKKLYFEIRENKPKEEINGFVKYKGKLCSIVLNDSLAIIYQK
jgi:hypothetical protein